MKNTKLEKNLISEKMTATRRRRLNHNNTNLVKSKDPPWGVLSRAAKIGVHIVKEKRAFPEYNIFSIRILIAIFKRVYDMYIVNKSPQRKI